nr:MAG TPA: hypothetical protein [Caudoviricetes sp.]
MLFENFIGKLSSLWRGNLFILHTNKFLKY